MAKLIILYDPVNGYCVPDARVKGMVDEIIAEYSEITIQESDNDQEPTCLEVTVGSELIIQQFRVAVKTGCINYKNILFKTSAGDIINIDKKGKLIKCPKGFCDHTVNLMAKLF